MLGTGATASRGRGRSTGPTTTAPSFSTAEGNSVEAVTHARAREQETGSIDHLWIRVEDLISVKRFYAAIAPVVELRLRERRVIASDSRRSAAASPSSRDARHENLHLAIGVGDQQTVERFHESRLRPAVGTTATPGRGRNTTPATTGRTSLIPPGTNLEAVFHDRSMTSTSATI